MSENLLFIKRWITKSSNTNYSQHPTVLQVELSSFCNALCLGCHRTNTSNFNTVRSTIPKNKLVSLQTFSSLLNSKLMNSLEEIEFCGTIDEPTLHPNFLEILELIRKKKDYKISIHTNGSTRDVDYWNKLASICTKFDDCLVLFNIDGLGDTNNIYRQNTKFIKIINNAQSFIQNGGVAQWQFLKFPWNLHQIAEASKLSKELGFMNFVLRKDGSSVTQEGLSSVMEKKKRNSSQVPIDVNVGYESLQEQDIECVSRLRNMYFLSCESKLWPCCFIPNGLYLKNNQPEPVKILEKRLYDNYDKNFNDLTVYTADEVAQHIFYREQLLNSFKSKVVGTSCTDKITRCADTCSKIKLKQIPIGKIEEYVE